MRSDWDLVVLHLTDTVTHHHHPHQPAHSVRSYVVHIPHHFLRDQTNLQPSYCALSFRLFFTTMYTTLHLSRHATGCSLCFDTSSTERSTPCNVSCNPTKVPIHYRPPSQRYESLGGGGTGKPGSSRSLIGPAVEVSTKKRSAACSTTSGVGTTGLSRLPPGVDRRPNFWIWN